MAKESMLFIPSLTSMVGTDSLPSIRKFLNSLDLCVEDKCVEPAELATHFVDFAVDLGFMVAAYPLCPDYILAVQLGCTPDSPVLLLDLTDLAGARAGELELYQNGREFFSNELASRSEVHTLPDTYIAELAVDCVRYLNLTLEQFEADVQRHLARGPRPAHRMPVAGWYAGSNV